ncbi:MAG: GIY-YIG nuclease family protein [Pseudomonadota bacterium]
MNNKESGFSTWSVYLVGCADGSFYTGVAKDVVARVEQHNRGLGAKYTRGRGPVELLFSEEVGDHGQALRREYAIKQLPKKKKIQLIASQVLMAQIP